nr:unnamed protein product [Callosobruchus analis]
MDDRSSLNSTYDIQTRSTRGATNRPGTKLNVKELSTTAKKPSSEPASMVEQYWLEPGMPAAELAENTCSTSSSITRQQVAAAMETAQKNVNNAALSKETAAHVVHSSEGNSSMWQQVKSRQRGNGNKRRSLVIGSGSGSGSVRGVEKQISLHVTRLHPNTKTDDMESMVKSNFPEAVVEKLNSKYSDVYSSFKVMISENNFKSALDADKWPKNACINHLLQRRQNAQPVSRHSNECTGFGIKTYKIQNIEKTEK